MTDKRKNYLSWDETFMQMSYLISQRSKDPHTQTGACVIDENKVIVGLGYNGWPRGIKDEDLPWGREGLPLDKKYIYVVHAEANAILNANKSVRGCTLYGTLFPCNECAKILIQQGIKEIVYEKDLYHDQNEWVASRRMLDLAGIKYRQYIPQFKLKLESKNKPQKIIIGITGTIGAGKGAIVEYLKEKGFNHYSVRGFLKQEIEKRNVPLTVDSMYKMANYLRKKYSPSFIVEKLYEAADQSTGNSIIESIRNPGEIQALKNKGNFYLIAVDADQKQRYLRVLKRKGDSADNLSFERFVFEETRQMQSNNPYEQNIGKCMAMVDFKLDNSGTFEELHQQIDVILNKINAD